MAAMRGLPRLRASSKVAKNALKNRSAPFGLVKMSQSYSWAWVTISAKVRRSSGCSMRMVGSSMTSAPRSRSDLLSPPACSRVRVTTMRLPNNGRFSNQLIFFRSLTTVPITATAGEPNFSASAISAMVVRVPTMVFWALVVAQRVSAMGVSGSAPCLTNSPLISRRRETPMTNTLVPGALASWAKSIELKPLVGSSWPVKIVSWVL